MRLLRDERRKHHRCGRDAACCVSTLLPFDPTHFTYRSLSFRSACFWREESAVLRDGETADPSLRFGMTVFLSWDHRSFEGIFTGISSAHLMSSFTSHPAPGEPLCCNI